MTIRIVQEQDLSGNIDFMTKDPVLLTNGPTVIFTGEGVFLGVIIWVPIDGGTFYFTDGDDDPIDGLVNVTLKGSTTRAGTFGLKNYHLTNGLKIIVTSAVGVVITVSASTAT